MGLPCSDDAGWGEDWGDAEGLHHLPAARQRSAGALVVIFCWRRLPLEELEGFPAGRDTQREQGAPTHEMSRYVTPDLPPSLRQGAQIKGSSVSPTGSPALSLLTQGSLLPGQAGHGIGDVWLWTPTAQGRSRNAVGTHVLENQPVPILQLRQLHVIGDLVLCVPQGTPEAAAAQELL